MSLGTVRKSDMNSHSELDMELKAYLHSIKCQLHCPRSRKQVFLKQFGESLSQYLEERPLSKFSDIVVEFGKPEDIASSFIEHADTKDIRKSLKFGRHIIWLAIAVAVVVVGAVIGFHAYKVWLNENVSNGFFIETITQDEASVPLESVDKSDIRVY